MNSTIITLDDSMLDTVSGGISLSLAPVNVAADVKAKANVGVKLGEGGLGLNLDAALSVVANLGLGALVG